MLPQVYFVRHGETDWNAEGRLQGQADTDLNAKGREQATGNGRKLSELIADPSEFRFVASPMRRTRQTMERVRDAMGLDPTAYETDRRLVEVHFGDWQGSTLAELEAAVPGSTGARANDKWRFVPPGNGAESYEILAARVAPFIEEIARPTVCVTHGGIIRAVFTLTGALSDDDAATLDIPQDRILSLRAGRLEWL